MVTKSFISGAVLLGILLLLTGCGPTSLSTIGENTEDVFSGGIAGTVFNTTVDAYSLLMPNATNEVRDGFRLGRSFFRQNWVTAGNSTEGRDGLGPIFNARSCAACHFRDGRTTPFDGNTPFVGLLLRISITGVGPHGEPNPDPNYGGQLQGNSIPGALKEGTVQASFTTITGQFADGETYELIKPQFTITSLGYGALAPDIKISPRSSQPMIGLGMLEDISESTILANADPEDSNSDGISGKPNYVWDIDAGALRLGRFGWKANQPSLRQQVAGAFLGDIGITSSLFPNENLDGFPTGGSPEISDSVLNHVTTYVRSLAVPAQRNASDETVIRGRKVFIAAQCNACHLTQIRSSTGIIRPYTDMLLHDMGEGLADNREDFEASGTEWRTAPLWGIGLLETVNGHTRFLHDGRARNLTEAILWHGGEAEASKEYFRNSSKSDRDALIAFLNSL